MTRSLILLLLTITASLAAQSPGTLHDDLSGLIDLVVSPDGSGDFTTLQGAIDAAPDYPAERTVIFVRKGTYREKVTVPPSKTRITLVGEDADSTVVVWDDYAGRIVDGVTLNTFTSQTIRIDGDDFRAMNLTFENDARPGGSGDGQNVAVSAYGKRQVFLHCRFIAWQDTYYSGSDDRHYLKDCFIEGAVDYIFGHTTTIFDSCQIHTVRSKGYITAAATKENYRFGYVFFNCRLTAPHGISGVYLGRPWKTFAQTVFFRCTEYENINPLGWMTWDGRENTCYYAEYQCIGPGSDTTRRVDWSHQLTSQQAAEYTMEQIFSAASSTAFTQDWDPGLEGDPVYAAVREHTVMFMDPVNMDARVESIQVDGEPVPGWDPSVYEYVLELPPGHTEIPELSVTTVNSRSSVSIEYPQAIPGFGQITVVASDLATSTIYRVYFSVDQAYSNASLDSITVGGVPIEDFHPERFDYDIILPAGSSVYFPISAYAHVKGTSVVLARPASLPGDATITVTAVDGTTTNIYTLHATVATGVEELSKDQTRVTVITEDYQGILMEVRVNRPASLHLKLFHISGTLVDEMVVDALLPGDNRISMDTRLIPGIYIFRARIDDRVFTGPLIRW